MKQKSRLAVLRFNMIGDKAFYHRVISIVIPIIIQNTVTNVVSLLDNVMVGRIGTLQMSAVAIINQLLFVFMICIFGGLAGAGIFTTQFAGANDTEGVRHTFRVKLMLAAAMVIIATSVFLIFPRQLISMYLAEGTSLQDASDTMHYSMEYLMIMLIGLVPFALAQVYASTLREVGETRIPMLSSIAAILVNLVFNYFLIFGTFGFPRLGVAGAAIATTLSRFVELAIICVFTHRHKIRFPFIAGAYKSMHVPASLCKHIAQKGTPLLANEFLWAAGVAALLQCYSVRGLDVVAAMNITSTAANLFNVVFISMGNAVAIMVGQALGADEFDKAKVTAWRLVTFSVATCFVMGGFMILAAPYVPKIYNTEEHVRMMATKLLYVASAMMPFYSCSHCSYFTLRSGGKTVVTFLFDSMFSWVVSVPAAYLLANFTNMDAALLYFLVQSLELFKCTIGLVLMKKGVWVHNIVGNKK